MVVGVGSIDSRNESGVGSDIRIDIMTSFIHEIPRLGDDNKCFPVPRWVSSIPYCDVYNRLRLLVTFSTREAYLPLLRRLDPEAVA